MLVTTIGERGGRVRSLRSVHSAGHHDRGEGWERHVV